MSVKTDHRLGRNFHKGLFGALANPLLAAAAFNFKRMMNKWKPLPSSFAPVFQLRIPRNAADPWVIAA